MNADLNSRPSPALSGRRVAILGRLGSMSKRDAAELLRQHGATMAEGTGSADLIVLGEGEPNPVEPSSSTTTETISETVLWQRLGLVEEQLEVRQLYTPAMLANLLKVSVSHIRHWHRRGWMVPVREVRRLPYFDFSEVSAGRHLAELVRGGATPRAIDKQLRELARFSPQLSRPLAQLPLTVQGNRLLLRQGESLVAPGGQYWFDFDAAAGDRVDQPARSTTLSFQQFLGSPTSGSGTQSPEEMVTLAIELEDEGRLAEAADVYRAALAAGGPSAELCFLLAELLYRLGDSAGARERYYMAIELDEDYVEARANLGCLLVELQQYELGLAAFEGALAYHPQYSDAHYHLARTLDELGRSEEALEHWRRFLDLAPESPWAMEAESRLAAAALR